MKKLTNNTRWGLIAMGMNLVILILVIVSAVQLKSYDNKNTALQDGIVPFESYWADSVKVCESQIAAQKKTKSGYENLIATEQVKAEESTAALEAGIADDSLKKSYQNKQYTATTHIQEYTDSIKSLESQMAITNANYKAAQDSLKPWSKKMDTLIEECSSPLKGFNTVIIITAVLLLLKVLAVAFWMLQNFKNIKLLAPWQKRTSNAMIILSWLIPIYNLFKPCSLFSEMISETKYALRDKSIISDAKDGNHMESIGFWWGSFLVAKVLVPFFIGGFAIALNFWLLILVGCSGADATANSLGFLSMGTFFGTEGLFFYLRPHALILALYIIAWVVYLIYDSYMIFNYNKLNKSLCDNAAKFELEEKAAEPTK